MVVIEPYQPRSGLLIDDESAVNFTVLTATGTNGFIAKPASSAIAATTLIAVMVRRPLARTQLTPWLVDTIPLCVYTDQNNTVPSEVSGVCAGLDAEVARFRHRILTAQDFLYVFLDATYGKARVGHWIVSRAIVVAVGVAADERREMLGFDVGDSENGNYWISFLRSLKIRGLDGVRLVISDTHTGLKTTIGTVFQGAGLQRCRCTSCGTCSP